MELSDALTQSDSLYRRLVQTLPAAIYACDAQGRITLFNDAAAALWGRRPELGKDAWCGSWRIFRPDGSPMPLDACPMAVALREGRSVRGEEIVIERPDGTRRNVLPHPDPILDDSGAVAGAVNMLLDITDRKQAEEAQALLASIVAGSDDAIVSKTLDGTITSWNDGARRIFGYEEEEVVGRPVTILIPADRLPEEVRILECLRRGERIDHFETIRLARDGRKIPVSLTVSPVRDSTGRLIGASKIARDISLRKTAEQAQSLLASIVAGSNDAIISKTLTGTISSWNEGAQRIFGYSAGEAVGRPITMIVPPDRLAEEEQILAGARRGDRVDHFETVRLARDGRVVLVSLSISPIRDGLGRIIGASQVARDVTQIKAAEVALRESEERYRTLAGSMPFIVWQADPNGEASYANRFFEDYSGWTAAGLRAGDPWVLVHPDDRQGVQERLARGLRTGEPIRGAMRIRRIDGQWRWFQVSVEPVHDAAGCVARWVGAAIDIDDRRRAEAALAAVRDDLSIQVAGLTRLHELSTILAATRELRPALRSITGAIAALHGAHRALLSLHDAKTGRLYDGASLGFTPEALESLARLEPGPRAGACGSCFFSGRRVVVEDTETDPCFADYRQDARDQGFRAVHSTPIVTRSGAVVGVLSVQFDAPRWPTEREIQFADMCARLAADAIEAARSEEELGAHRLHLERMVEARTRELAESHQRLRLSERMALLGTLSAGLGHDMGNLLMPIRVRIESLERAGLSDALAGDVRAIRTSAEYLQRLSNGLRLLAVDPERSRGGQTTELRAWWTDAEPVFRNGLPRGTALLAQVPDGEVWAEIAKPALTQAVFNLVQNAGDALRPAGRGRVTVPARADEHCVWISISDDGPGMTEDVRQRCMEPFFTTKSRGISTGLGLVLVAGLVRDAGGTVDVQSEIGRGTTFTLELRRSHASPPANAEEGPRKVTAGEPFSESSGPPRAAP